MNLVQSKHILRDVA